MTKGNAKMLNVGETGNMEQVREALAGITGVKLSPDRDDGAEWHMLIVRPNHEFDAVDSMRRQGLRAYWPNYERLVSTRQRQDGRIVRRAVRTGIVPYVFSPVDRNCDFTGFLEKLIAVVDVVRTYSGNPLLLRDTDIKILRKIDHGLNTPKPTAQGHTFKLGEKVRFVDDNHQQWPAGKVVKLAREGRLSVEVDMMGRKVPVTVFPHQIERM
jgi:transcription antitermination factor NusG